MKFENEKHWKCVETVSYHLIWYVERPKNIIFAYFLWKIMFFCTLKTLTFSLKIWVIFSFFKVQHLKSAPKWILFFFGILAILMYMYKKDQGVEKKRKKWFLKNEVLMLNRPPETTLCRAEVGWGKHSGVSWARGGPIKKNEQFINYTNGIFQNMILYNLFISKKRFTPPPPPHLEKRLNKSIFWFQWTSANKICFLHKTYLWIFWRKNSSPCYLPVGLGREPCPFFFESEWDIAYFSIKKNAIYFQKPSALWSVTVWRMQDSKPVDRAFGPVHSFEN